MPKSENITLVSNASFSDSSSFSSPSSAENKARNLPFTQIFDRVAGDIGQDGYEWTFAGSHETGYYAVSKRDVMLIDGLQMSVGIIATSSKGKVDASNAERVFIFPPKELKSYIEIDSETATILNREEKPKKMASRNDEIFYKLLLSRARSNDSGRLGLDDYAYLGELFAHPSDYQDYLVGLLAYKEKQA